MVLKKIFSLLLLLFNKNNLSIVYCDHGGTPLTNNNCNNSFKNYTSELIDNNNSNNNKYKACSLHFDGNTGDNIILRFDLATILCANNTVNISVASVDSTTKNTTVLIDNKNLCEAFTNAILLINSTNSFHIDLNSNANITFSIINYISVTKFNYANSTSGMQLFFLVIVSGLHSKMCAL